ncbi:MAG: peptide chain release factor N(5)-glutamine methyltransferase [Clostridium sp.]|nr:peptide chain release factor N(5)-glutamine methyltransferase [Clostridium sp.]
MDSIKYLEKYLPKDKLQYGLQQLQKGIPPQYIVGNVEFYGYKIKVNKNVLIPRFETEELVEKSIYYIKKFFDNNINILDIGTGSGCISIALKKNIPNVNVTGIDISSEALEVAKENAIENSCNINFIQSDLFENIDSKYDVIISNPPYIDINEDIMDIVRNNEPHIALFAKNNGLYFYEKILKDANKYLNAKSLLAFEIGYLQGEEILNLSKKYFPNSKVSLERDLQGKDRFIFIFNL